MLAPSAQSQQDLLIQETITASLVEGSHHVREILNMTGQLHVQKLLQPLETLSLEPEVEASKLPRCADSEEPFANESKLVQVGALTASMSRAPIKSGRGVM